MKLEKRPNPRIAVDVLRVIAGSIVIAGLLYVAGRVTRDCTVGLYIFDICSWVWVREQLGLPASKFLRAGFLEVVGITLALGIYLAIKLIFPSKKKREGSAHFPPT